MKTFLIWLGKCLGLIVGVSLGAALLGVPWILYLENRAGDDVDLTIITRLPLEIWALISGLIVIALFLRLERAKLSAAYLRWNGVLSHSLAGGVIGLFAAGASAIIALLTGQVELNQEFITVPLATLLLLGLSVFLNALLQEMMFRGYVFHVSERAYGVIFAIIMSSLGFVLVHGGVYSGVEGLFAGASLMLAGLGMAFMVLATRSIWLATGYHWGWNMSQAFISDEVANKAYTEGAPLIINTSASYGINVEHTLLGLFGPAIVAVIAFLFWRYRQPQTDSNKHTPEAN
ncbi:MAG: type II CAAX endopeptidase family protein [Parvibaculaceae bacterium]